MINPRELAYAAHVGDRISFNSEMGYLVGTVTGFYLCPAGEGQSGPTFNPSEIRVEVDLGGTKLLIAGHQMASPGIYRPEIEVEA